MKDYNMMIEKAKKSALDGEVLGKADIIALLEIDPFSEDCGKLGAAAREVATAVSKDQAYLWAAIGIDYRPCPMNCHYCSLGESWGLVMEESELSEGEIIKMVQKYVQEKVQWIVLRTTQFYPFDKLMALAKEIRRNVSGKYQLVANAGEFNEQTAAQLVEAGFDSIYHTVRLREGIDTKFDPEERIKTLKAISQSPLKLVSLVEPVGVEHTNDEIAEALLTAIKFGAVVTGAMARVPVKGTPLGEYPALAKERLAQIVAITRLTAGFRAPDICVHQASELAFKWGANVAVVESGSIPRDSCCNTKTDWNGFDPETAKAWFKTCGYKVGLKAR
ncbi:radical SAM protein [Acetobacterium woodii]|nr:radical SAM protein [Acetobacterium woodii]